MALVMQPVKVLSFIPVTDELMMDAGWMKEYPTWADTESTPMWRFEDEAVLVMPKVFEGEAEFYADDGEFIASFDDDDDDEDAA